MMDIWSDIGRDKPTLYLYSGISNPRGEHDGKPSYRLEGCPLLDSIYIYIIYVCACKVSKSASIIPFDFGRVITVTI